MYTIPTIPQPPHTLPSARLPLIQTDVNVQIRAYFLLPLSASLSTLFFPTHNLVPLQRCIHWLRDDTE